MIGNLKKRFVSFVLRFFPMLAKDCKLKTLRFLKVVGFFCFLSSTFWAGFKNKQESTPSWEAKLTEIRTPCR
jgi:hypothetical protein